MFSFPLQLQGYPIDTIYPAACCYYYLPTSNINSLPFSHGFPLQTHQYQYSQTPQNSQPAPYEAADRQLLITNDARSSQIYSQFKRDVQMEKKEQKNTVECKEQNRQKFGRNIGSNIFHLLIKFIGNTKKIRKLIQIIIQKNNMLLKVGQFYQLLLRVSRELGPFVTYKKMQQLWHGEPTNYQRVSQMQADFSKILRILGKQYLQKYHLLYVYNSNKIKKSSKKLHADEIRKILSL